MEKFGTENLKKGLRLAFALGKQTEEVAEDKKFKLIEIPLFFDELLMIPGVVEAAPEIVNEALDLSTEERTEINDWAKKEFDLKNDEVEEKVEAGIDWIISTLMLKKAFAKKKPGDTVPTPGS